MKHLALRLRPAQAGQLAAALAQRLGALFWRLLERRAVRVVLGFPIVMACLAGGGVRGWVIALVTAESLVVLGFWSVVLWWARRFDTGPLFQSEEAGSEASVGRPARQPGKEVDADGIQAAAGDRAADLGRVLDVG